MGWGYIIVFPILFAIGFYTIYLISARYRQEEFYQRLNDRMSTISRILPEVDQIDPDMLQLFDKNTINNLYDEKILLFNAGGDIIYNSIVDSSDSYPRYILQQLINSNGELRTSDGKYELLGLKLKYKGQLYYGITKAYDRFGMSKLSLLKNALIIVFIAITFILVFASLGLAKLIIAPISKLAKEIDFISSKNLSVRIEQPDSNDEINMLARKFNELLDRLENTFKFQYHFIHHVSHELKTPLSVMMANTEGALSEDDLSLIKDDLNFHHR